MKTLTDFKRYLKNGGKIQLISVDGEKPAEKVAGLRTVEKMQTNSCKFVGGSWLYFPLASKFLTDQENKTVNCDGLIYQIYPTTQN